MSALKVLSNPGVLAGTDLWLESDDAKSRAECVHRRGDLLDLSAGSFEDTPYGPASRLRSAFGHSRF